MAILEAKEVYWRYAGSKKPILENINLRVDEGEFVAITGPSGAGKTTLVLTLIGVIPQRLPGEFQGKVLLLGYDTSRTQISEITRNVGVVFEDPEIQFVMSNVEDEILLGLEPLQLDEHEIQERIEWSLNLVGLDKSFLPRSPLQLSGGEKQRVAIAAAVARRPKPLILDEPTSDLDPQGKEEVVSALRSLINEYRTTVVMVEHEPELIVEFADRLLVMDEGRIVLEGKPSEVYELGETALKHAAYPPDYIQLARQLNIKARDTGDLLRQAYSNAVKFNGVCNPRVIEGRKGDVIVSIRDVWFEYKPEKPVIRGVDLELRLGELVFLMGPNGSGKTTLSKLVAGLLKPSKGEVLIDKRGVGEYTREELSSIIAYIYQNPQHQIFNQTVWDEVAFGWRLRGVPERLYAEKVEEALKLFNLKGLEEEHPFFLSKGEKRRLAIASVYALNPKVLVVDEPTTGQDRRLGEQLMSIFRSLVDKGKTVLVVTHSVGLAYKYADRLLVMVDGRIIADGSPRLILEEDDIVYKAHLRQPVEVQVCKILAKAREHSNPFS
ncbi:MAG: ABC transporter ATP-binding protein [Infirmifilum sp.]